MKFSINPKIFEKFPSVEIGVLVITRMDNQGYNEEILKLLRDQEKTQKEELTGVELGSLPEVASWRKIYKDFGSDPRDYRSSVEALLRRARAGNKPLPQINNLVDLYNYLSLKYHLPAGAEDIDKVVGDIELTFAKGDEKGKYIGGDKEEVCDKGEVIYKDKIGFICRRWNWREADRTKIDFETKNVVLVIEKAPGVEETSFKKALEETKELISKFLGGKTQLFILDEKNSSFEIDFRTGSKAKEAPKVPSGLTPQVKKKVKKEISTLPMILPEDKTGLSFVLRQIIFHAVKEVFGKEIGEKIPFSDIQIEHPANKNYGDYSTNIAMILAGRLKIKPRELAEKLAEKINFYIRQHQTITYQTDSKLPQDIIIHPKDILENVSCAGQGFINLSLAKKYLISQMQRVLEKNETDKITQIGKGKKIMVEYTDPNPFKEFHLGHLYSNSIGESISRIFETCGVSVWRGNFYGDVGMHIAKSVYGLLTKLRTQPFDFAQGKNSKLKILKGDDYIKELRRYIEELEKLPVNQRQKLLGEGYALGTIKYDEDKKVAEEIKEINYLIYVAAQEVLKREKGWQPIINYKKYIEGKEERLKETQLVYEAGLKWSLEYFETIYKRLGTKFDGYYPESWVGEYGMKLVEKGLEKGILEKSDGSVIYRGEQDGLHTRVFVNKLGLPTYEAKDLGLAYAKYQDFQYDLSINVFGKEIDEYYRVVKAALTKIAPELGKKAYHLAHGMVKLPEGKMSSRTGNVITFEWLIEEVKRRIKEIIEKTDKKAIRHPAKNLGRLAGNNLPSSEVEELEETTEKVAIAAIRYSLLKQGIGEDIVFDFDKSLSFEGDSGPYLLYTYARCKSVLRKAQELGIMNQESRIKDQGWEARNKLILNSKFLILNSEEVILLRTFYLFPEVVAEAARTFSPNLICSFLFELAQAYNLFYQKHSILGVAKNQESITNNQEQKDNMEIESSKLSFRLALTSATAQILKQGLYLLGIKTVERM